MITDADHHPDESSVSLLMAAMLDSSSSSSSSSSSKDGSGGGRVACVQGSTYIRNARGSLLARAVDAEFFVTHFIYFPAMQVIASSGYFGGSNALWRTAVVRMYPFDAELLTEDVDVSARALLGGHTMAFCPEARSGELSPVGTVALVTQRLRWFMGWEQVCMHTDTDTGMEHPHASVLLKTQCAGPIDAWTTS